MSYQSETIATIVNRLNRQHFLPAIQREFVWEPDQITTLFDSLMRGYPIGSLLFWELRPENHDRWQVYRFMEDYRQDESHNQLANTNGVQQLTLVLDGQQRLTSLLSGSKAPAPSSAHTSAGATPMPGCGSACTSTCARIRPPRPRAMRISPPPRA